MKSEHGEHGEPKSGSANSGQTMTRDESNRKIAETLGWHAFDGDSPSFSGYLHEPSCTRRKYGDKCFCIHEDNPDFYHSEEANALVRTEVLKNVQPRNSFFDRLEVHARVSPLSAEEWRALICEAYLAMLEKKK